MTYAVEMLDIVKRFPDVVANDGVTLTVESGTIHAVIGENGAGKSTLMGVLYGLHRPDSGNIRTNGEPVTINSPQDAIALNIGMVHQHFMLAPSLTVAENIVLGVTRTRWGLIDLITAKKSIAEISSRYGLAIDLDAKVYDLSVGAMQRVEILKTLYRGAQILIMDEPTSVLTPAETDSLFDILKRLAEQNHTIIFISHKLKEILRISQQVSVMRNGKIAGEVETAGTDENELARLMVGRDVVFRIEKKPAAPGDPVLKVKSLSAYSNRRLPCLRKVSFEVCRGEIVGIAGVEGNGQSELAEVLTGLRPASEGSITCIDRNIIHLSVRQRRELGIAHIPEDRLKTGADIYSSITENLIINTYHKRPLSRWTVFNPPEINALAGRLINRFNVATVDTNMPLESLSGGNIQKVVLARELEGDPDLLIASQPTRGVDVGAIEFIHQQLILLRDSMHGILLISADLDEILSLSDRILVMYEGAFIGEIAGKDATEEKIGLLMAGAHDDAATMVPPCLE
jgi:simple sugar transport system ATP-binding protein